MTISQRRWLLICFFIVFVLVSPLMILYASGYRYNTRLHKIEQVGLLSVSTKQSGTEIRVDDMIIAKKSSSASLNLSPQTYLVQLSKPGYHTWQKSLPVYEGQTTFAHEIRLFAESVAEPIELFANPLTLVAQTPEAYLYTTEQGLVLYRVLDGGIVEGILPVSGEPIAFAQISKAHTGLFQQAGAWYTFTVIDDLIEVEEILVPANTKRVFLVEDLILAVSDDRLWEWDKDQFTPLFTLPSIQSVTMANGTYVVMAAEATKKRSFIYSVTDASASPLFITSLPYSETWQFAKPNGTLLLAFDSTHRQLQLIDTRINPPAIVALDGVFDWHWSADGRSLLVGTANEIAIYRLDNGLSQELLLRQSEPITDIAWSAGPDWILYTSASRIYALERDGRDQRNQYLLAENKNHPQLLRVTEESLQFSSQQDPSFVIWQTALTND